MTGQVRIADEVISTIASSAVLETEGVAGMAYAGRKRPGKGVSLKIEDGKVKITVAVMVAGGVKIQDVAANVQQKVKDAVETMTGFVAEEVNVHISGMVA